MRACSDRFLAATRRAAFLLALIGASSASFAGTEVSLTRRPDKSYEVSGIFSVDASTSVVWAVLTDYAHIPAFVSSMRSSRVRQVRDDGSLLVEQKAAGGLFFLSKVVHILLEVRRSPERLQFSDVSFEDFRVYAGDWAARRTSSGVDVSYHLRVQPRFFAPPFLVSRATKSGAGELLDQVRAEIVRRELPR